jgi:hypothetical protein
MQSIQSSVGALLHERRDLKTDRFGGLEIPQPFLRLRGLFDARIDLTAKNPEINRLRKKRFGAAFQGLALGLGVPIRGDHDNRR